MNIFSDFWWPFDLSDETTKEFVAKKKFFSKNFIEIDQHLYHKSNALIEGMMKKDLVDMLDKDSLPTLCHIINGWGNAKFENTTLLDKLESFINYKENKKPFILQCYPEGDFHPWQSFAYSAMAGIDGDTKIGKSGTTFQELLKNSTFINHHEGEELGHLLFALAVYINNDDIIINFKDKAYSVQELLDWAIKNHFDGEFRVCRKFHLTEGICALVSLHSKYSDYSLVAQKFLEGQLDIIFLLAIILTETNAAINDKKNISKNQIVQELRKEMVLLGFLENHIYYAGHIIELAALAELLGYEITIAQKNAINFVINSINQTLTLYAPNLSFKDSFLGIGHFRRAMSLINAIKDIKKVSFNSSREILQQYTVDFNKIKPVEFSEHEVSIGKKLLKLGIFDVCPPQESLSKKLSQVIDEYNAMNKLNDFELKGKFTHFRRVNPNGWPRTLHFEILDYGEDKQQIGLEFHLEGAESAFFTKHLNELKDELNKDNHFEQPFQIDSNWYHGAGRVFALYPHTESAKQIARNFSEMINLSYTKINSIVKKHYQSMIENTPAN